MTRSRRGRDTERAFPGWLRTRGWPFAEACTAYAPGPDITRTPGFSIEIKARTRFDPGAALRQAEAGSGLAIAVLRMNGQRTTDPPLWLAVLRVGALVETLRLAGYGDGIVR